MVINHLLTGMILQVANIHQTFKVPKMEESSHISCMDTAYVSPKIAGHKVQETLHFRYLKFLVKYRHF